MPELNGEAFVPPFCPALNAVDPPQEKPRQGEIAAPEMFVIDFPDFKSAGFNSDSVGVDVYFTLPDTRPNNGIDITPELIPVDPNSEEGKNVGWLAELDDPSFAAVQKEVARRYCERIKRCGGAILRDGKPVCSALDFNAFHPMVTELRIAGS